MNSLILQAMGEREYLLFFSKDKFGIRYSQNIDMP